MMVHPGDQAAALEIRGVTVRFGGLTALDDVSLTAAPRQVTGIIGPNGAGKTTLLNVLCGFVRPDSRPDPVRRRASSTGLRPHRLAGLGIARTLQGVGLFGGLSVGGERHGRRDQPRKRRVLVGAARPAPVGPGRAAGSGAWSLRGPRPGRRRRPRRQPAGDAALRIRKRIALARALVARPRLLLLDEPASGLSESELPELGDADRQARRRRRSGGDRAPDGPDDVRLRHDHRARLRRGDRGRAAGPGAGRPGRHRRVPGRCSQAGEPEQRAGRC